MTIAFTAAISSDFQVFPPLGTIIWEEIITNIGGGFNPGTGIFTCPQDGHYFFSVSVTSNWQNDDMRAEFQIVHNGNALVTAPAMAPGTSAQGTATNSAVIDCMNGGQVWIRCRDSFDCNVNGNDDLQVTSFSGFLI